MAENKTLSFQLPSVSGKEISLDDYPEAKGYLVVFTCNHCPYAVAYEDRMIALQAEYGPKGIPLIAISVNDAKKYPQDSFEQMKVRSETKGFNFEYLYDESQAIAHAYGAERTPHVFLLNPNREIVYSGAIDDNYQNPSAVQVRYVREAMDALLAGKSVPAAQTNAVGCSIKWK